MSFMSFLLFLLSPFFILTEKIILFGDDWISTFTINGLTIPVANLDNTFQTVYANIKPGDKLHFYITNPFGPVGIHINAEISGYNFMSHCTRFWTWDSSDSLGKYQKQGVWLIGRDSLSLFGDRSFDTVVYFPGKCVNNLYYANTNANEIIRISDIYNSFITYSGWEAKFPLTFKSVDVNNRLKEMTLQPIIVEQEYYTETIVYSPRAGSYEESFTFYVYDFTSQDCGECTFKITMCYETCKTCNGIGIITLQKCLTCNAPLMLEYTKTNCIQCITAWYKDTITLLEYCLMTTLCLPTYPYQMKATQECIKSCPLDLWIYKMYCYTKEELMLELRMNYNVANMIQWKMTMTIEKTMQFISDNSLLSFFVYLDSIFEINGYNISLTETNQPKGISYTVNTDLLISLNDCEKELRKENTIPNTDSLYIFTYRNISEGYLAPINITVFSKYNTILNHSCCEDMRMLIDTPFSPNSGIDLNLAKDFDDKGIDVTNKSDPFFTDYCFSFQDEDGFDIVIKDRQELFFQNITLTRPECIVIGYQYETWRYKRNCIIIDQIENKPEYVIIQDEEEPPITDQLFIEEEFPVTNVRITTCYHQLFIFKYLINNISFWFLSSILFVFFICFHSFYFCGLTFLYSQLQKYPDRYKRTVKQKIINNKTNPNAMKTNPNTFSNIINTNFNKKNINHKISDSNLISSSRVKIKTGTLQSNTKHISPQRKQNKLKSNIPTAIQSKFNPEAHKQYINIANIPIKNEITITNLGNKNEEIEGMNNWPYTKSLREDKRNIFIMFIHILKNTFVYITPFTSQSPFDHYSVKFGELLINITVSLTINAIFFSDSIVSEKYYTKGDLFLASSMAKSLYSTILNSVICSFISSFSEYQMIFELVIKEYQNPSVYLEITKKGINKVKRKVYAFFCLGIVVIMGCWYFTVLFCNVYRGSQKSLFVDELMSIAISSGISLGLIIVVTILRYISLKAKWKYMYYTSNYILRFG